MKKIVFFLIAGVLLLSVRPGRTFAGSCGDDLWKGLAIGASAAIVADLLLAGNCGWRYSAVNVYAGPPRVCRSVVPVYVAPSRRAIKRLVRREIRRERHWRRWRAHRRWDGCP